MKKLNFFYFLLLLISSCNKKHDLVESQTSAKINNYGKVINFLANQSAKYTDKETLLHIQYLKESIDSENIKIINYHNSKAIVVSLRSNDLSTNSYNKLSIETDNHYNNIFNRLIFYVHQDTIAGAESIECRTNMSEDVLNNDISGVINFKPNNYKGEVRYRKLNQKFLYTLYYENMRNGYLVVKKRNQNDIENKSQTECNNPIDWYLVTTYTYPDGTQTITEEFIIRTCGDPDGCVPDPYLEQIPSGACSGGGGSSGGNPSGEDPNLIPRKQLCGNYSWKTTGAPQGAGNTVIKNLWATFAPDATPWVRITVSFSDACITIPNHCSTNQNTLSQMFNSAFNAAVLVIETGLSSNTIPPADEQIKAALYASIKASLIVECPGSHFVNQGCTPDIPWKLPTFCD